MALPPIHLALVQRELGETTRIWFHCI